MYPRASQTSFSLFFQLTLFPFFVLLLSELSKLLSAYFYKIKCTKTSLNCWADFYNWNRVKLRYCDGGSFMGDSVYINSVRVLFGATAYINLHLHPGEVAYCLVCANFCSLQCSTLVVRGYGMLSSLICLGRDWREPKRFPISFPCNLLCPCQLGIVSVNVNCFGW